MKRTHLFLTIGAALIVGAAVIGGIVYATTGSSDEIDLSDPKRAAQQILDRMPIIDG